VALWPRATSRDVIRATSVKDSLADQQVLATVSRRRHHPDMAAARGHAHHRRRLFRHRTRWLLTRHFRDLRISAFASLSVKMAMLNNIPAGRHEARPIQPIKWLRIERKTLYLLFAFGLASCASAPENLFVSVSQTASGVSAVDMLVATTRRSAENPGELYSGERSSALTFANIVVSLPPDSVRIAGEV
jgi:hypothetical protein